MQNLGRPKGMAQLLLSRLVLILALLFLLTPCLRGSSGPANNHRQLSRVRRIVGHDLIEVDDMLKKKMFPFSVSLIGSYYVSKPKKIGFITIPFYEKKYMHCGANILGRNHVITAAHCLKNSEGELIASTSWRIYMFGVKRKPDILERMESWIARKASKLTGQSLAKDVAHHAHLEKAYIHPNYDHAEGVHDIAIIKTSDIRHDGIYTIAPIRLPPKEVIDAGGPEPGAECFYAGWGCNKHNGDVQDRLLAARLFVQPLRTCTELYMGADLVKWGNNLCVHGNRTNICSGDSGGGLFCVHEGRAYLAGIASSGYPGEGAELHPANFMRISAYASWIRDVMETS